MISDIYKYSAETKVKWFFIYVFTDTLIKK